jgi:hypothetical protein
MKRINVLSLVVTVFVLLASCSTTKEPGGVWVNKEKIKGKSFSNIFIVVMTADLEARSMIENDLAAAIREKGYKAVKSIDVIPSSLKDPKLPPKEEIINKVKENGCDAIFVSALVRNEDSVSYTASKTIHSPGNNFNYSGNFFGYYNYYYHTTEKAAYYTMDKKYFVQSNLYDAATQEIMWSIHSQIFNPSSLKNFSIVYAGSLIQKLETSSVLEKAKKGE